METSLPEPGALYTSLGDKQPIQRSLRILASDLLDKGRLGLFVIADVPTCSCFDFCGVAVVLSQLLGPDSGCFLLVWGQGVAGGKVIGRVVGVALRVDLILVRRLLICERVGAPAAYFVMLPLRMDVLKICHAR